MTPQDIPFAIGITDKEGWGYTEEDFQRLIDFEPEGCFVAYDDDERIGMLTTTSYGRLGWIGNVVVRSDRRQERIGADIVEHAVRYLRGKSTDIIGLYSYLDSIPFYERIGFLQSFRVSRFSAIARSSQGRKTRTVISDILPRIAEFDQRFFPGDRSRVIQRMMENFPHLVFYVEEGEILGYIVGFCSPKACEIGPWVCDPDRPDLAKDLLIDCLTALENTDSSIAVPNENKSALEIVGKQGFAKDFEVSAMFFESDEHGMKQGAIFGVGALEKG